MLETTVFVEDWRKLNPDEKRSLKQGFSEGKNIFNNESGNLQPIVKQSNSEADEIKKYKELLDMGAITQEEFDTKKKQLLGV